MFSSHIPAALLVVAALVAPPAFATNVHRSPTSGLTSTHKLSKSKHKARRARGQQAIEPERVTEIQQALIREHYLTGEANGKWDATTVAAMQKYQADHGWQTKLMPDSRALMKLGLGPDYSTAINAKGSSFAAPTPSASAPPSQTSGFVAASGVNQ
jgi:peptidoglycan hydrolase-like protein with peptidoglycan-binding domain